jgi:hypothetical protein
MSKWLNRFRPWGVLLLRLVLGTTMVLHRYPKVIPSGGFRTGHAMAALDHYAHYIATLGMPR